MNKKTVFIRLLILAALVLSIFLTIQTSQINKPFTSKGGCDITVNSCTISHKDKTIGLSFEKEPEAEEELFLNFGFPETLQIKNAWIEGVNMYMGKTPILFEDANNRNRGVTFLGSCNLSEMEWVLYVEFEPTNVQQTSSSEREYVSAINESKIKKDAEAFVVSASFYTYLE